MGSGLMFSGIIQGVGEVVTQRQGRLEVRADLFVGNCKLGDSIAISGVCLTVIEVSDCYVSFDLGEETLRLTTLARLKAGDRVNLELALKLGDGLHGHFVLGHVDLLSQLLERKDLANHTTELVFSLPHSHAKYVATKGSIAIDGISLTIGNVGTDRFSVYIIPHTFRETTLSELRLGDFVNIEIDVIARYLSRLIAT